LKVSSPCNNAWCGNVVSKGTCPQSSSANFFPITWERNYPARSRLNLLLKCLESAGRKSLGPFWQQGSLSGLNVIFVHRRRSPSLNESTAAAESLRGIRNDVGDYRINPSCAAIAGQPKPRQRLEIGRRFSRSIRRPVLRLAGSAAQECSKRNYASRLLLCRARLLAQHGATKARDFDLRA
jgi:hypothetical protein